MIETLISVIFPIPVYKAKLETKGFTPPKK